MNQASAIVRPWAWSETTRVRVAARIMACAVFALALAMLAQRAPVSSFGAAERAGAPVAAIMVELRAPANARPVQTRSTPSAISVAAAPQPDASGGGVLRLWVDGASGEVIFRDAEQFQRCRQARVRRAEAPDCPSHTDTRSMILASR